MFTARNSWLTFKLNIFSNIFDLLKQLILPAFDGSLELTTLRKATELITEVRTCCVVLDSPPFHLRNHRQAKTIF